MMVISKSRIVRIIRTVTCVFNPGGVHINIYCGSHAGAPALSGVVNETDKDMRKTAPAAAGAVPGHAIADAAEVAEARKEVKMETKKVARKGVKKERKVRKAKAPLMFSAAVAFAKRSGVTPNTAANYDTAWNTFRKFLRHEFGEDVADIPVGDFTNALLLRYDNWLRTPVRGKGGKGRYAPTTRAAYTSPLRAIINKASAAGFVKADSRLFDGVHTNTAGECGKEPLTAEGLNRFLSMETREGSWEREAQLTARFIYLAGGIAPTDLARLTKDNIKRRMLVFRRHKTDVEVRIPVTRKIEEILSCFHDDNSDYLFPPPPRHGGHGRDVH